MKKQTVKFIVSLVLVLVATAVLLMPIAQSLRLGLSMGRTTTQIYEVSPLSTDAVDMKQVETIFSTRAELLKTSQYRMYASDDNKIVLEVPSSSQTALIKTIMSQTMNLEIRGTDDALLISSKDIIKATVLTSTSSGYETYSVQLQINPDALKAATDAVSTKTSSDDKYLVVWSDFVEGSDTYAAQKTISDNSGTPKYLSTIYAGSSNSTGLTSFTSSTLVSAKQMAAIINAGSTTYAYSLVSEDNYGSFATDSLSRLYLTVGSIVLIYLVGVINFIRYKKTSLVAFVGVGFSASLSLYAFNLFGGILSLQALIGFWLSMTALASVVLYALHRAKQGMLKGLGLSSALRAGYDGLIPSIIVSSVFLFAMGLLIYLGNIHFVRDFGMMIIICSLVNAVLGFVVTRGITLYYAQASHKTFGALFNQNLQNVEDRQKAQKNFSRFNGLNLKKFGQIGVIASLLVLVIFIASVAAGFRSFAPDQGSELRLVVNTVDDANYLQVQAILQESGISQTAYKVVKGVNTTSYNFASGVSVDTLRGTLSTIQDATKVSANAYAITTFDLTHKMNVIILLGAVFLAVIALLFTLSYHFNLMKASFTSALLSILVGFSLLSVLFGVTSTSIVLSLLIMGLTVTWSSIFFTHIRDNINDNRKLSTQPEIFAEMVNTLYSEAIDPIFTSLVALVVITIGSLLVYQGQTLFLALMIVLVAVLIFVCVSFVQPYLVLVLYTFNKKEPKAKKPKSEKKKKKAAEKEELTVIGIND